MRFQVGFPMQRNLLTTLLICNLLICLPAFAAKKENGFDAFRAGDVKTAVDVLSKPTINEPIESKETCRRYMALAAALVVSNRYDEAAPLLQHLLKDPITSYMYSMTNDLEDLGCLYELRGKFAEAESLYKRAIDVARANRVESLREGFWIILYRLFNRNSLTEKHELKWFNLALTDQGASQFEYQLSAFYKLRGKEILAKIYFQLAEFDAKTGAHSGNNAKALAYKEGANFFQKCFRTGFVGDGGFDSPSLGILYGAAVADATFNPPQDSNSAHLLAVIAESYESSGHYEASIKTSEKALAILKRMPNPPEKVISEVKLGLATALDFSDNSSKAADVYLTIPNGPASLAKTLTEWAEGYQHISYARASANPELYRKAQILYHRVLGLKKGSRLRLPTPMPNLY